MPTLPPLFQLLSLKVGQLFFLPYLIARCDNPGDTTNALARHTQTELKHVVPISKDSPGVKAHARLP
jgi:hypothetical protein